MRVVLFDLGGVLVRLGGVEEFGALVGTTDEGEIWRLWLGSPAVRCYERGLCSREEFARAAIEEFRLGIPPEDFLARFLSWPKGLLAGAAELVGSVRSDVHRAVLSNTNELHWNEQPDASCIHRLFETHFASHLVGLVKPDAAIFERVVEELQCSAAEILFLDDNQINVEGARAVGFAAHRVVGVDQARAVLAAHDLLAR
jgi:putative hydrolase of the HAD superfamily